MKCSHTKLSAELLSLRSSHCGAPQSPFERPPRLPSWQVSRARVVYSPVGYPRLLLLTGVL